MLGPGKARVNVTADLDRVRVRLDGRIVADHARVWARGSTITDAVHVETAKRLRQQFQTPRPAPVDDLARDLADSVPFDHGRNLGMSR